MKKVHCAKDLAGKTLCGLVDPYLVVVHKEIFLGALASVVQCKRCLKAVNL